MTAAVPLDIDTFRRRLVRFREVWSESGRDGDSGDGPAPCDAVMFTLGQPTDFTVYQKTTAVFSWLLGYEFPETTLVISRDAVAFLTSQRKGAILDALAASDPQVHVLKREKESGRGGEQFEQLWGVLSGARKGDAPVRLGVVAKDKNEGPMTQEWLEYLRGRKEAGSGYEEVDVTARIGAVLADKDNAELQHMRAASRLTSLLMTDQVCKKILGTIDGKKRISHAHLADEIESFVTNQIGRFRGKLDADLNMDFVDMCYPPIVQSGTVFSLKPSAVSNEELLSDRGAIICAVGLRYRAYCANMARTLLIDPSPEQEERLKLLQSLQQHLAGRLVPGASLRQVYEAGVQYVREQQAGLEKHLVTNFGFGIGIEFREPEYLINSRTDRTVRDGMTFNLMVGLQDLVVGDGRASQTYSLMLSDTVQAAPSGAVFLTEGLGAMREISYSFKKDAARSGADVSSGPLIKTRLRSQSSASSRDDSAEKRRREHQRQLGQLRIKEALERYAGQDGGDGLAKKPEVLKFESYRKDTSLPKEISDGGSLKIFVDRRNETVILPIYSLAVPFHINTIKNITKNDEGDYSYLRINFNSPGRTFGKKDAGVTFEDPRAHFIRGITIRTADVYRAQEVFKGIQELKKQVGEREAARKERADLVEQGQLVEASGRRPGRLTDIYVRPSMDSKRLPGDLEIHSNGLRYRSQLRNDQRIDVLFANVKHFFFQPCDHEALVILHLHLHHPIMIGKKKTRDIQFYREALESLVDETGGRRTKMRFGDEDEIAQEQEERQRRMEANQEFRNFAEKVVDASRNTIEVDVPFRDLGFTGVPYRQNVLLQPTTDCLVHLIEPPFLITALADIEVAFLERVVFGLKNFDLVLVSKDHAAAPVHINSIPMTQLEAVKEWLDSVDVYFVESKVNFNWTNIMKTVNEDPAGFYEMGGWTYLQPGEAEAGSSDEENGSSEYEPEEEAEEEEGESDAEDDDGDDDEDDEEYDDDDDDEEEEDADSDDDAPDWDELEEEARREDEHAVSSSRKRTGPPARPAPSLSKRRA